MEVGVRSDFVDVRHVLNRAELVEEVDAEVVDLGIIIISEVQGHPIFTGQAIGLGIFVVVLEQSACVQTLYQIGNAKNIAGLNIVLRYRITISNFPNSISSYDIVIRLRYHSNNIDIELKKSISNSFDIDPFDIEKIRYYANSLLGAGKMLRAHLAMPGFPSGTGRFHSPST